MKLKLSDVKVTLPLEMNRQATSLDSIARLVKGAHGRVIDFDVYLPSKGKNLQRPFVWTLLQKRELILSMLKGVTLQPLSIIEQKNYGDEPYKYVLQIVDGKQRLSTLMSFYKNEFSIIVNGKEYYYDDLEPEAQHCISNAHLTAFVAYEYSDTIISDDVRIAWFEQINFAGTQQDIDHLNDLKLK